MATIIETDTLLKVVGFALAWALTGTIAFSFLTLGVVKFEDARRDERALPAAAYVILMLMSLAVCLGLIVLAILAITKKT